MNYQSKASWHDILEQGVTLRLEDAQTADLAYRAADGVVTPALLESLRYHKDSLCRLLRPGFDYLPLSPTQKRMWLQCRTNPESPFYNMAFTVHLKGQLDNEAIVRAAGELPFHHPVLRASFPLIEGQPVQELAPADTKFPALELVDLSHLPPHESKNKLRELATQAAMKPFAVGHTPLWTMQLVRLEPQHHALLFNIHHLLGDRWSIRLLVQDLSFHYASHSNQTPGRAQGKASAYIDFALWQQRWLQSEDCDRQLQYWKEKLAGVNQLACLPLKHHGIVPQTRRGDCFSLSVPAAVTEKLKTQAQETGTTLFTVLLGAFKLLIRQCSGLNDVRVGSMMANRNRYATRRVVGLLANNVVLRTDFEQAQSYREALLLTKETVDGAIQNQNVAFDQVTALPAIAGLPVFEVYFTLLNVSERTSFSNLDVATEQTETGTAKIDLTIRVREEADGLQVDFIYDADMIETDSVNQIALHYGRLLEAVAADLDVKLADLPFDESLKVTTPTYPSPIHAARSLSDDDLPRDDLERQLAAIWQDLLQVPRVGIRDDFFTLGGHSLLAVRLLDTVEKATGKTLSLAIFFQAPTIEGQAALLRNEDSLDIPSLIVLQPHGTRPPLFCIDGAVRYRALAESLPSDQPVYGLIPENPTDGQWYSFDKIGERATHYLKIIKQVQPEGPYQLAGLSFAGLVALMIAKQLHEAGDKVHLLALFDTYGPGYFSMPFSRRVGLHLHALRKLDVPARAQYLRDRARLRLMKKPPEPKEPTQVRRGENEDEWQVDVFDRELSPEEIRHLRSMAQHVRQNPASARYEGDTILFVARDKPMEFLQADTTLGWNGFAPHLTIHEVPGDHTSLIQKPNVGDLATLLRPALSSAPVRDGQ